MAERPLLFYSGRRGVVLKGGWRTIEASSTPLSEYACPTTIPQEQMDKAIEAVA